MNKDFFAHKFYDVIYSDSSLRELKQEIKEAIDEIKIYLLSDLPDFVDEDFHNIYLAEEFRECCSDVRYMEVPSEMAFGKGFESNQEESEKKYNPDFIHERFHVFVETICEDVRDYRVMQQLWLVFRDFIDKDSSCIAEEDIDVLKNHMKSLDDYDKFKKKYGGKMPDIPTASSPTKRKEHLFSKEGNIYIKDEETTRHKATLYKDFLRKNGYDTFMLSSSKVSPLNQAILSFLKCWKEEGCFPGYVNPYSVSRFMIEDCGIKIDAGEKSFTNAFRNWQNEGFMDENMDRKVRKYLNI